MSNKYGWLLLLLLFLLTDGKTTFHYRTYSDMVYQMNQLNKTYSHNYLDVFTAQEKYGHFGIPTTTQLMCPVDGRQVPCQHYVMRITNKTTLPDPKRPHVFFSGALHGNERVGPNTVMELALLLLKNTKTKADPWLNHLLNTRIIVLMPMTNAYGYAHNTRTELRVDTNRDYNYMHAPKCMMAITSRAVNEVWRDHIFQLALTFHAGMRAIAYEWGSPNHYKTDGIGRQRASELSPDDLAQKKVTQALSEYGGRFQKGKTLYPTGTMNELVYGVTGGMEDWGYAASWENQVTPKGEKIPFQPCEPTTFGGYNRNRTIYNNVTHRAFNVLIETSNNKIPQDQELGNDDSLQPETIQEFISPDKAIGHLPRNLRLALMMVEMVQPYVVFTFDPILNPIKAVDGSNHCSRDVTCGSRDCKAQVATDLFLSWEVLGSFHVDSTRLVVRFENQSILSHSHQQTGYTRRYWGDEAKHSVFTECIRVPDTPGTYYIQAEAKVDQDWATGNREPFPHVPPQSHLVNARTNPNWKMENQGSRVVGRLNWKSEVIELTVTTSAVHPVKVEKPVERLEEPHLASALGYMVVGFGGVLIGIVLTLLVTRVFRDRGGSRAMDEAEVDQLLRNPIENDDELSDLEE